MNFIREIVGGPKNRFKENQFNLDLTYISSRLIAMAFPASGIEKVFRNSIDTVADFLYERHGNNYMVINVSTREIDETKLRNVKSFSWQDHKSPHFGLLFQIASLAGQYLAGGEQRVVVVHCNHGKGRTGTLICCLLLFLGAMDTDKQAMEFYAHRRFEVENMGVTQPCQRLYIRYFHCLLKDRKLYPRPLSLSKVVIKGHHELNHIYIKVKNLIQNVYLLSTHHKDSNILEVEKQQQYTLKIKEQSCVVIGDTLFEIKHESKVGNNLAASFTINTAFVGQDNLVKANIGDLSPLSAVKSGLFKDDFALELHFRRICGCPASPNTKQHCPKCTKYFAKEQGEWQKIFSVVNERQQFVEKKLFGSLQFQGETRSKQKSIF